MPEIDLKPSEYRWRRPLNKRIAWTFVALGIGLLAYFFWTKDEGSTTSLFAASTVVSFGIGLIVAGIFRDFE